MSVSSQEDSAATARQLQGRLLAILKRCVRPLGAGHFWGGQQKNTHYVDSMGDFHATGGNDLAMLMCDFLHFLIEGKLIEPFQCVIAKKDGNPFFAAKVAALLRPSPIPIVVCKGDHDRSRVRSIDNSEDYAPHEIDFEGLRALSTADNGMRAVIVDDNLAGAASILSIRRRVSKVVRLFEPVCEVVTLYAIVDPHTTGNFEELGHGANLYTLLKLDNDAIHLIYDTPADDLCALLDTQPHLSDGFGTEWLRGEVPPITLQD